MPYTTEQMSEREMEARTWDSVCGECFAPLLFCWGGAFGYDSMILRCSRDPKHEGIARFPEERQYNIAARREFMVQDHGEEKALALRKFDAVATLDKKTAMAILQIMWPEAQDASPAEFAKALGLCVDYGLDPRLNELFLIPFKKKDEHGKVIGKKYETVRGIKATRKIALRKHRYSFMDYTPRLMTEEEELRVYKKVDPQIVRYITKLKDLETGAEAPGYGEWPMYKEVNGRQVPNKPKGVDKGNSMENQASIHSERAALERLYPADMPSSRIRVVDESFVDAEYSVIEGDEGETGEEEEEENPDDEEETGGGERASSRPVGGEKKDEPHGTATGVATGAGAGGAGGAGAGAGGAGGAGAGGGVGDTTVQDETRAGETFFSPTEGEAETKSKKSRVPRGGTPPDVLADRQRITDSAKRMNWAQKTLISYLQNKCNDKSVTSVEMVPDDLVHKLANELADWELMS